MRNLYFALLYSLVTTIGVYGQSFELKFGVKLKRCDLFGTPKSTEENVKQGWTFVVENTLLNGDKIITINEFTNEPLLNLRYNQSLIPGPSIAGVPTFISDDIYFLLPRSTFNDIAQEIEGRFGFGTVLLPLKIRPGERDSQQNNIRNFDFTSEFNLGLSIGYRVNRRKALTKQNILLSVGLTTIPVDATTTNNLVTDKTNAAAVTPSFGYILTLKSGLQISVLTGIDYLSRELGRKWEYKHWPWVGIGIGFSIFKFDNRGEVKN